MRSGRAWQFQCARQRLQSLRRRTRADRRACAAPRAHSARRKLQPATRQSAAAAVQLAHGRPATACSASATRLVIGQLEVDQDLGRRRLPRVVEQQEFGERLGRLAQRRRERNWWCRGSGRRAPCSTVTPYAPVPRPAPSTSTSRARGALAICCDCNLAQARAADRAIARHPRTAAPPTPRHALRSSALTVVAAALQHPQRRVQIAPVVLGADQTRRTAPSSGRSDAAGTAGCDAQRTSRGSCGSGTPSAAAAALP